MSRNAMVVFACAVLAVSAFAQGASPAGPTEPVAQTPGYTLKQQLVFDKAKQDFGAEQWAEAFSEFSDLHKQLPDNAKISEFLAESALNLNNTQLAISLMEPIRKASPERWEASELLARAYAETNRDAERDAEIANLQHLHDMQFAPKIARLQTILLERRMLPNGSVRIWYSLTPWGKSNTYLFARVYDRQGVETYHMNLDSSDMDQALWAKNHPKEAAAGERVFFLDGYSPPQKNPGGTITYKQALLGMYDGKPVYDLIRDKILAVAAGHSGSMATSTSQQPQ